MEEEESACKALNFLSFFLFLSLSLSFFLSLSFLLPSFLSFFLAFIRPFLSGLTFLCVACVLVLNICNKDRQRDRQLQVIYCFISWIMDTFA